MVGHQLHQQTIEMQRTTKNTSKVTTFNQVRFPTSLTGNVEDMRGCGYGDNSDTVYAFWEYKSFDNRYYLNGYGGSYMQGNPDGQYYCTAHVPILG